MAITNYTELQTAVGRWLNRRDLAVVIPDFIALAEAKIRRDVRKKVIRNGAFTLDAEAVQLPGDFEEPRSLAITSPVGYAPPKKVSKAAFDAHRAGYAGVQGAPRFVTYLGNELLLSPAPDQDYTAEITYFEKLPSLSGTVATNSVLAENPDIYLYGALAEAEPYLKNDPRVVLWKTNFEEAKASINRERERKEFPTGMTAKLPVVFG